MPDPLTSAGLPIAPKNSEKKEKMLGYFFLAIGITIITATTVYAALVLTGKIKPAKVFDVKAPQIPVPSLTQSLNTQALQNAGLPPQVLESLSPKQNAPAGVKIIPDEVFTDLINMFLAYILVMIMASSGAKFASIGIQLIKEIKVQAKG